MDDLRVGAALRAIRLRRGLCHEEVAITAGMPRSVVGSAERGRFGRIRIGDLRALAAALDITLDLSIRWQGGDLHRLINARHAAMHEELARRFGALKGWAFEPEVSFSIFGERGVIDGLAWHAASGSLLVIELKTEFVDINDLMGTVDRKRRKSGSPGDGTPRPSRPGWPLPTGARTGARSPGITQR